MANSDGIRTFGRTSQPRVLFPVLYDPKQYKNKGKYKYSASFLFDTDSEEFAALKKAAVAVAREKWPELDIAAAMKAGTFKLPFHTGTKLKKKAEKKGHDGDFYEGQVMMKTSTEYKPTVLDARQDPPVETFDQKLVFSGCFVAGEVNFVAYNGDGEDDEGEPLPGGVTAYLNCIVFVERGDRIAGRDHAAAFAGIKGSASKEDPTAEDDEDEIEI